MTNAEAIETLRANYPDACYEQLRDAVDTAIEALKSQGAVNEQPAADVVERKMGTWIEVGYWSEGVGMGESYGNYFKCSVCEKRVQGGYRHCYMNFCPMCGAKMNEVE